MRWTGNNKALATYSRVRGGTVPTLEISERSLIERIVARDGLKFAFIVWLSVRLVLSLWGIFIVFVAPQESHDQIRKIYPDIEFADRDFAGLTVGLWNIYDTRHYVTIADQGYDPDPGYLTAFFPGYPLLVKLASTLMFGQTLLASIVVSNAAALFFFWYLYRLVEADFGQSVARRAVILGAVFPTSFYLFLGYTEAPLLAFTVAALYYGRQQKWIWAGVLAACAALVKQPGIALIIPLGYMYWRQYVAYADNPSPLSMLKSKNWAWLLLCPLAPVAYLIYRYFVLAAPIAQINDLGADEVLTLPGVPLIKALLAVRPSNPLLGMNLLDISFAALMIGLVVAVILKIRSNTYNLYAALLALMSLALTWPNADRPEVDMPRRILIIFPIFIYLALITEKPRVFRYVVMASISMYLMLSALFINWIFIS